MLKYLVTSLCIVVPHYIHNFIPLDSKTELHIALTYITTGHQGVIKTYLTIGDNFFTPGLIHCLCSYIKGCHIYQLSRNEKPPTRQLQTRIILNYRPLSQLSMDLQVLPRLNKGHKYILCIVNVMTNYLIAVPNTPI